jgi:preprotein translocase subunit SecA
LTESELKRKLLEIKAPFQSARGFQIDAALSVITEVMERALGKRPYTVQLMAALAMHERRGAEMGTGEGKTLAAALCAVLYAWDGNPCHVVTSNDYLAKRDALALRPFYEYCGLSVGYIAQEMDPDERRRQYACSLTYATSNNLLADYLKDQLQVDYEFDSTREQIRRLSPEGAFEQRVLRDLHSVIVDEADSVLGDDAITPLIISVSEQDAEFHEASRAAAAVAGELSQAEHYTLHENVKVIELTSAGLDRVDARTERFPISWRAGYRCGYLVNQALIAQHFYTRDKQYVVLEGKIVIVDEKTGRMMPQRSWSHGLHQAVEAKEGVELTNPTKVSAKMSFQSFFRLYRRLTGMSGTFHKIKNELWLIYKLPIVRIPPRLKKQHTHHPERIYLNKTRQLKAVIDEITARQQQGRAVLVGTRSVKDSQCLSDLLTSFGVANTVLNALHHEREADIIAQAGQKGRVTIATNMAGRGTDIGLDPEVLEHGGLHVIATERHESRRVDLQLYGRASRQGQPGSSIAILSLEDQIMQLYLPPFLKKILKLNFRLSISRHCALWAYRQIQVKVEKHSSKTRVNQLRHEIKLDKSLSFVGWHSKGS